MSLNIAPKIFLGSCLCGAVKYEVRSEIKAVSHCHCRMCQKAHGAAFGTYGSVPKDSFLFTAGTESLRSYASSQSVRRTFCATCGSTLTWHDSQGAWSSWIAFSLGTLDSPFIPRKHRHIHLESRPSWHVSDEDARS
ncbi:GFA family protein [Hydrogenophaga sp. A37]|uniref:GFA family protein n=1 Tax=Hydrogenophaga sp. A37 TaxID=1945864 RepID=UPI000987BC02|nr:GFA family protein [Hydrogenophaga sp. A37]OOG81074.1 hypothetical protein B0E41_19075 [Hydrogenophaga sp. A37]